jgi:hypothetical protein
MQPNAAVRFLYAPALPDRGGYDGSLQNLCEVGLLRDSRNSDAS